MPVLSDNNLSLLLQELPHRPTIQTINASPDRDILKGLWSAMTFYQWTPAVRQTIDAAIQSAMTRRDLVSAASAVAQTRDAMMADPDFYPFCLSPQYWPDAQRAHFRGLVGQTTYQPPAYWHAIGSDAMKMLAPVFIGVLVGVALPEELVGGAVALAATRIAGKALTETATKAAAKIAMGTGLAATGSVIANAFTGPSASAAAHDAEMWRRYQLEAKRRATA